MIAVTGVSGLLGAFLALRFRDSGKQVVGLKRTSSKLESSLSNIEFRDADVLDPLSLVTGLEGVETVVHAAGLVSFNPRREKQLLEVNTEGTRNVVNACLKVGAKKLIFISSVAAFGRQKGAVDVNEETRWVEGNLNSHYAKSKYLAELEVFRGQEEGLQISIINPSVILAPTDWNRSSAQLFKYIWNESKFYTTGKLNYVDVRDVADLVYQTYSSEIYGERFIANAGSIELIDLFRKIALHFNRQPPAIKVSKSLASAAAAIEELRARLMGYEPLITRQSVKMTKGDFHYSNAKSIATLNFRYRTLKETLEWCCAEYRVRYTTNN